MIEPPTIRATFKASRSSSSETASWTQRIMWYVMQSLQRNTVEATRPSNSLVLGSKAPFSYARLSRAKNRLIPIFWLDRIRVFMRSR